MMRDRLVIEGNVISATPWNLRVSFISNLFQPENVTIFVKMAYGRRAATHLLVLVFAEPFVGAGCLLAGGDDLRNTRLSRFGRKKPGQREFSCPRW